MSFSLKCYLSFNPYKEHTTELDKQHCPIIGHLPTDYIQLEMCIVSYSTIQQFVLLLSMCLQMCTL